MAEASEQNRSETPTPFKLRRAREKGQVARSAEVGFLAGLVGLSAFVLTAGEALIATLAEAMRTALSSGFAAAAEPSDAAGLLARLYGAILPPPLLLGGMLVAIVVLLELVQLRGLFLTFHPLKPDWSRLNPAKGLKRLFSLRMLKETLKSLLKFVAYATAAWMVVRGIVATQAQAAGEGERIAVLLRIGGMRLILAFLLVAIGFAIVDQLLVRREFTKQMRMSRREVTRENREREGEPRIKQRRKQLHREMTAQARCSIAGSDMLVVNPEHFAVALRYDDVAMAAPEVAAKGRGEHALRLRRAAGWRGVPIIADPPLARALFRACTIGATIPADRFEAVAAHYIALRRSQDAERT